MPAFDGEWFDEDTRPAEKHIALPVGIGSELTLNNHAAPTNELSVCSGWLQCSKRGGVQDHWGGAMFAIQKFGVIGVGIFDKAEARFAIGRSSSTVVLP